VLFAEAELVAATAHVGDGDGIEASLDAMRKLSKDGVGDVLAVRGGRWLAFRLFRSSGDGDGAFERAHHIAQADLARGTSEVVTSARSALGAHQSRSFQVLENLLEEAGGNRLAGGDVLDLRWSPVIVEGDVEEGANSITPFVRELHGCGLDCHIGYVKNSQRGVMIGGGGRNGVSHGSADARALHAAYPAIDLHADTLMWSRWIGYDLGVRHEPFFPASAFFGHVDVPRLVEGGIGAQFFGLVSLPIAGRGNVRAIDEQIDALDAHIATQGGRLSKVRSAEDVDRVKREGSTGALLGIEGAHALDGDLDRVAYFARRGVRYLGLLHFSANEAGFPAYGAGRRDGDGLTAWGQELVRRCEASSVIVDLAHINRRGFLQACAMSTRPLIVSHTGVARAHQHWRNIDDEQIRAVAARGGVVGIIFCPRFLGGDSIEDVVRHLRHVVDIGGEDTPALGSDWDGMIVPTPDLCDAAHLPLLTDALLRANFTETAIAKVLRQNALRVLRDCPVGP